VLDVDGRGVSGARVSLQNQQGEIVWAITNPFGYYRFTDVQSGLTYEISVAHKRFTFQSRTINVVDELVGVDFIAIPAGGLSPDQSDRKKSSPTDSSP
jgi:hypothetical protein